MEIKFESKRTPLELRLEGVFILLNSFIHDFDAKKLRSDLNDLYGGQNSMALWKADLEALGTIKITEIKPKRKRLNSDDKEG